MNRLRDMQELSDPGLRRDMKMADAGHIPGHTAETIREESQTRNAGKCRLILSIEGHPYTVKIERNGYGNVKSIALKNDRKFTYTVTIGKPNTQPECDCPQGVYKKGSPRCAHVRCVVATGLVAGPKQTATAAR